MKFLVVALLFVAGPAFAQQSPASVALQINGVIGTWAQTLEQQGKTIEGLQRQSAEDQKRLSEANAKIKELQDKYETPKKE